MTTSYRSKAPAKPSFALGRVLFGVINSSEIASSNNVRHSLGACRLGEVLLTSSLALIQ